MTDSHLVNTLKMIKRAHDRKVLASCAIAVNDFMEQAVNAYDLAGPELTCYQAYPRLLEEALRRGLKVSL
jgi:hypothetical protein